VVKQHVENVSTADRVIIFETPVQQIERGRGSEKQSFGISAEHTRDFK
jgi:hypothetical protein